METRYLEDGLLIDAVKLKAKTNNESNIYAKGDDFLKIYGSFIATDERKKTVILLEEFINDECCIPKYLINKGCTFKGLGTPFYRDYKCLEDIINSIQFKDRIIIARKIALLIESFIKQKYVYYDLHPGNIMVKDTNIKLIDMDGGYFSSIQETDYLFVQNTSYINLCGLILSILYGIDDDEYLFNKTVLENIQIFKRTANKKQMQLLNAAISDSKVKILPSEFIDYFSEEYIEETKPMLIL